MSDAHGEKRFDATPAQRERAKRSGNAAHSAELAGIASFAGALLGLTATLPIAPGLAAACVRAGAGGTRGPAFGAAFALVAAALVPACGASLAAGCASLAQTGGLRLGALRFAPEKLAPAAGLRRMFGPQAALGAGRAGIAFAVVLAAVTPIGLHVVTAATTGASVAAAALLTRDAVLQTCWAAVAAGAFFGLADYGLTRRRWLGSLKMTFEAFRRDAKEHEGDPHAKSRRRRLHQAFARGAVARTREASFVVVNPTHIAIALRYAPPEVAVPEVLVRAADARAFEVRALAERHGITVIEDVALARLLWRTCEAGRPIASETFVAVALVIAALIRGGVLRG